MKKLLRESKKIRIYLYTCLAFALGILMVIPFVVTKSDHRFIPLVGFLLAIGSFIYLIVLMLPIQYEVKVRFPKSTSPERRILHFLFYFTVFPILFAGLYFFGLSLTQTNRADKNLLEINGKIEKIYETEGQNKSLKIKLDGNTNEYGINTFRMSDQTLQAIKKDLLVGSDVFISVDKEEENKANDRYIQMYGIRTDLRRYYSVEEYQKSDTANRNSFKCLGGAFFISGIFMLFSMKQGWQNLIHQDPVPLYGDK